MICLEILQFPDRIGCFLGNFCPILSGFHAALQQVRISGTIRRAPFRLEATPAGRVPGR